MGRTTHNTLELENLHRENNAILEFYIIYISFFSAPFLKSEQFEALFSTDQSFKKFMQSIQKDFDLFVGELRDPVNFKIQYQSVIEALKNNPQEERNKRAFIVFLRKYNFTPFIQAHKEIFENAALLWDWQNQKMDSTWPYCSNRWLLEKLKNNEVRNDKITQIGETYFKEKTYSDEVKRNIFHEIIKETENTLWLESFKVQTILFPTDFRVYIFNNILTLLKVAESQYVLQINLQQYELLKTATQQDLIINIIAKLYEGHANVDLPEFCKVLRQEMQRNVWIQPLEALMNQSREMFEKGLQDCISFLIENVKVHPSLNKPKTSVISMSHFAPKRTAEDFTFQSLATYLQLIPLHMHINICQKIENNQAIKAIYSCLVKSVKDLVDNNQKKHADNFIRSFLQSSIQEDPRSSIQQEFNKFKSKNILSMVVMEFIQMEIENINAVNKKRWVM